MLGHVHSPCFSTSNCGGLGLTHTHTHTHIDRHTEMRYCVERSVGVNMGTMGPSDNCVARVVRASGVRLRKHEELTGRERWKQGGGHGSRPSVFNAECIQV